MLKNTSKVSILAKYGGEEYLEKAPKELLQGQTEDYVEYSRTGQVVAGRERAKAKSKYPEDGEPRYSLKGSARSLMRSAVMINNHTSVWGSWYDTATSTWGYACCQSNIYMSYCSGQAGIEAAKESTAHKLLASSTLSASLTAPKSLTDVHAELDGASGEGQTKVSQNFSKKRVGDGDVTLDRERLAQALSEERKRKGKGGEDEGVWGKKRKTAPSGTHDVTEEELGTSYISHERRCDANLAQRRTGCTVGWMPIPWQDTLTRMTDCIYDRTWTKQSHTAAETRPTHFLEPSQGLNEALQCQCPQSRLSFSV